MDAKLTGIGTRAKGVKAKKNEVVPSSLAARGGELSRVGQVRGRLQHYRQNARITMNEQNAQTQLIARNYQPTTMFENTGKKVGQHHDAETYHNSLIISESFTRPKRHTKHKSNQEVHKHVRPIFFER